MPTTRLELLAAAIFVLFGSVIMGFIVGSFSELLTDIEKDKSKLTAKFDTLQANLTVLKLPEDMHIKCLLYQEQLCHLPIVQDDEIYEVVSPSLANYF